MAIFRKRVGNFEITEGAIYWNASQDDEIKSVIPDTFIFELRYDGKEYRNLAIDWEKRKLFIGEPLSGVSPGSELTLSTSNEDSDVVICSISNPEEDLVIRKRLSHNEFNHRHLKWYAREDELYRRLFPTDDPVQVKIGSRLLKLVYPDFQKRKLRLGEALRVFSPGEDILLRWDSSSGEPILSIDHEELVSKCTYKGSTPVRAIVAKLISRPLSNFKEGDIKALLILLDENKNLWEQIGELQEENKSLKDQVSIVESVFEQLSENQFFDSKKCFVDWIFNHIGQFEKGIRIIHRDFNLEFENGKHCCVDFVCQDKKGILTVVEVVFNPETDKINNAINLIQTLENNLDTLSKQLTDNALLATSIRGVIITNFETAALVESCLQSNIKLFVVKSGYAIDVID